jgi:hypothetical protein
VAVAAADRPYVMPLAARIPICTVLVILAGLSPVAWLVASEYPPSPLGQWSPGIGGLVCAIAGVVIGCWRPKPPRGFPIEIKQPKTGA